MQLLDQTRQLRVALRVPDPVPHELAAERGHPPAFPVLHPQGRHPHPGLPRPGQLAPDRLRAALHAQPDAVLCPLRQGRLPAQQGAQALQQLRRAAGRVEDQALGQAPEVQAMPARRAQVQLGVGAAVRQAVPVGRREQQRQGEVGVVPGPAAAAVQVRHEGDQVVAAPHPLLLHPDGQAPAAQVQHGELLASSVEVLPRPGRQVEPQAVGPLRRAGEAQGQAALSPRKNAECSSPGNSICTRSSLFSRTLEPGTTARRLQAVADAEVPPDHAVAPLPAAHPQAGVAKRVRRAAAVPSRRAGNPPPRRRSRSQDLPPRLRPRGLRRPSARAGRPVRAPLPPPRPRGPAARAPGPAAHPRSSPREARRARRTPRSAARSPGCSGVRSPPGRRCGLAAVSGGRLGSPQATRAQ